MTRAHVAHDGTGYRVYGTHTGVDRTYHEPRFATPRPAIAYCRSLNDEASRPDSDDGRSDDEEQANGTRSRTRTPRVGRS